MYKLKGLCGACKNHKQVWCSTSGAVAFNSHTEMLEAIKTGPYNQEIWFCSKVPNCVLEEVAKGNNEVEITVCGCYEEK